MLLGMEISLLMFFHNKRVFFSYFCFHETKDAVAKMLTKIRHVRLLSKDLHAYI